MRLTALKRVAKRLKAVWIGGYVSAPAIGKSTALPAYCRYASSDRDRGVRSRVGSVRLWIGLDWNLRGALHLVYPAFPSGSRGGRRGLSDAVSTP